jgi:D-alanyl-D-alanine dipeptidase
MKEPVAKSRDARTLAGMTRKHILHAIFLAVVVSVVLNVISFAQSTQQELRITPVRPIAELRAEALKATPPEEPGPFLTPYLAELTKVDPSIHLDIRLATSNNVLGEPVYEQPRAFLRLDAADALKHVSEKLRKKGYGLLVYDAYRPWYVTKILWDATPEAQRGFLADPARGARHNLGSSVDLTLYDLKTGAAVAMPSEYDDMSPRANANYAGASPEEQNHRVILRKAMEKDGFVQLPSEWWHFDYKDWQRYGILNLTFDQITASPYEVGRGVTPPKVLKHAEPDFSEEAKNGKFQGTVLLSVVIGTDGMPHDITVKRGLGHGLDEKAVAAVKQWRFEPGKKDGKAVPTTIKIEINFHLF